VPAAYVISRTPDELSNWSLFAQDTWKATRTLTITYGLRWEYDAAPSASNGQLPFTVTQVNNFGTMTLAPPGTPLWHPQQDDFAPRLGLAWQPLPNLVLRAGAGIFYDLGYSAVANATSAFPFTQENIILNTSFPLSTANAAPPPFTDVYYKPNPEFTGEFDLMRNDADSSYQSLQAQFRHRLAHGLLALLSYAWAHSIDDVVRHLLPERASGRLTFVSGACFIRLRHPAHVLRRSLLQHSSAGQRNL
jgi:hypothetical protein